MHKSVESKLPKENSEREEGSVKRHLWYPANTLFKQLRDSNDEDQVAEKIINSLGIILDVEKNFVMKNVRFFYKNIFTVKNIGIAKVLVNKTLDELANRQRIVELFRRLNSGGTRLEGFDLMASIMKGFNWEMERFLDDTLRDYRDINFTQDELIKLIFILRDNYKKQIVNIDADDANFAVTNKARINSTLNAMKKYLHAAKLFNYYNNQNRSFIPLYFIAYHIFHKKSVPTEKLENLFHNFDTSNIDFLNIYKWLNFSLLNGVFSRGKGWVPDKTGVRKILETVKKYKDKPFPFEELVSTYKKHPLRCYFSLDDTDLNNLDAYYLFHILYDGSSEIRIQDIDHIHPRSLLQEKYENHQLINTVENYQLLDRETNRGLKNGKPFKEWLANHVADKEFYLSRHYIPKDPQYWEIENYEPFLKERKKLIIAKLKSVAV